MVCRVVGPGRAADGSAVVRAVPGAVPRVVLGWGDRSSRTQVTYSGGAAGGGSPPPGGSVDGGALVGVLPAGGGVPGGSLLGEVEGAGGAPGATATTLAGSQLKN